MKNSEDRIQRDKEIEAIESYALSTGNIYKACG